MSSISAGNCHSAANADLSQTGYIQANRGPKRYEARLRPTPPISKRIGFQDWATSVSLAK